MQKDVYKRQEFDELKKNAVKYSKESLETKSNLAQKIIDVVK